MHVTSSNCNNDTCLPVFKLSSESTIDVGTHNNNTFGHQKRVNYFWPNEHKILSEIITFRCSL